MFFNFNEMRNSSMTLSKMKTNYNVCYNYNAAIILYCNATHFHYLF